VDPDTLTEAADARRFGIKRNRRYQTIERAHGPVWQIAHAESLTAIG
jgi:hypothetical protein